MTEHHCSKACGRDDQPQHAVLVDDVEETSTVPTSRSASDEKAGTAPEAALTAVELADWPTEPEELGKGGVLKTLSDVADWVLVLMPAVFIVLGIAICTANGRPTKDSRLGQRLEVIVRLGPTIFPLLFAAVAARSLKVVGRYLCQRGARLGTVELLLASRSVWGTFESQFLLRRCTVVGAYLLLLWALSPVGGQASLRALRRMDRVTRNTTTLRYLYTGPFAVYLKPSGNTFLHSTPVGYSLLAPRHMKTAPRDTWGNIRVPQLDQMPDRKPGRDGWFGIPHVTQPEQYASLLGLPLVGLPPSPSPQAADFTMEASYMSLACSAWETFPERDRRLQSYRKTSRLKDPFRPTREKPPLAELGVSIPDTNATFFVDADMPSADRNNASVVARDPRVRQLFFVSGRRSSNASEYDLSATRCNVSENHAEVRVHCPSGLDCAATGVRRSTVDTRPTTSTPLDFAWRRHLLVHALPYLGVGFGDSSSEIERFLRDSASVVRYSAGEAFVNLSEVPPAVFSRRLAVLLNVWFFLNLAHSSGVIYGGNPNNVSDYGFDFARLPANGSVAQSVVDESCRLFCTRSTVATLTDSVEVFTYSGPWLALLFASSTVLLLTGLAGTVLSWRTRVPDMLGYVSSMTYNNRYLALPERGGVLDAMHRARHLRDLHVTVSDVEGGNGVGRIAFTSDANVRALEKGRKYI